MNAYVGFLPYKCYNEYKKTPKQKKVYIICICTKAGKLQVGVWKKQP